MEPRRIRTALISVYDKTGIVDFARALVTEFGIEIISTGGTAKLLKENGLPVTLVDEITGFPELLDGRVKTLHPKIFAGILADRDNPEHMRQLEQHCIKPIDMVVVNLYPFAKTVEDPNCTFEQAIEMIDIGGVALLRAAAKNHKHVLGISNLSDTAYALCYLRNIPPQAEWKIHRNMAITALNSTALYDGGISCWLSCPDRYLGRIREWSLDLVSRGWLRYGENPHQEAELYDNSDDPYGDLVERMADQPSAKPMSLTNYLDADSAFRLCHDLHNTNHELCSCVFVKHTNPCGAAKSERFVDSYRKTYLADPLAAMGGVLAVNKSVDTEMATIVMDSFDRWGREAGANAFFVEVWVAPDFSDSAVEVIRTRREWGSRVRLVEGSIEDDLSKGLEFRAFSGGLIRQQRERVGLNESDWKVVTKRKPTDAELADLRLAWLIAKHTKSNAISICKDGMLIGNGAGQMSRVMSCRIASWLAKENGHEAKLPGSVAASDGFFPFDDGPKLLMDAGVTAIIQPGGSKRDEEVIRACDERDVAMIFTGIRHFKH